MTASHDSIIRAGLVAPMRAGVQEPPCGAAVQVAHRQVEPVAQQRTREFAADIAEPDEADVHACVLNVFQRSVAVSTGYGHAIHAVAFGISSATPRARVAHDLARLCANATAA